MRTFPIPNFRPIETKADATNEDRTVLRRAEGVVAVALGALSPGPYWRQMWGLAALKASFETALAGADAAKTHFVLVARGNHKLLVAWSLARAEAVGLFHVAGDPTVTDFSSASGVTITATNNAVFRDKDGSLPWFMSTIDKRLVFGNGVDANLTWNAGALAFYTVTTATNVNDPFRETFPACTCFAMGNDRNVYATGNAAAPLRVWVARPPNSSYPDIEGVYSVDTSTVDILGTGATAARALSVWQSYVSVHLDNNKVVNLFAPDQDNTGQAARQQISVTNASAPNPNCASDALGSSPYYLGADGELYKDEAVRTGPYSKLVALDIDLVTAQASGDWNAAAVKPLDARYSALLYDRRTNLAWIFARTSIPADRAGVWCYAGRNDSISGPFRYPNAAVVTLARAFTDRTVAIAITGAGELLYSTLSDVQSLDAWEIDAPGTALGAGYAELGSAPTPSTGVPYVGINAGGTGFAMVVAGKRIELATPWSEWTETSALTLTRYFNNAHLGIIELGYTDVGINDRLKQFLSSMPEFSPRARACIGIFAESERGNRSGRWYGSVFEREEIVIPHALLGQRVRLRLLLLWFNDQRAELRKATIGYEPVGQR